MKIVFRVDASIQMGTGHVMRCLTLAKELKENGLNVEFITRKHEGNLIIKIRSSGFIVHELEVYGESDNDNKLAHSNWLGSSQNTDADDCIEILKVEQPIWLIVDHYALDERWEKRLKPYYKKLMVLDDLADRKHQCDILLDQTFGRQKEDYETLVPSDCILLLGSKYALLRPEFAKWRDYSLERRSDKLKFKKLFISMGGTDADNYTGQVLDELKNCSLRNDFHITVVMGSSAPHLKNVMSKAIKLPFVTEVKVDVENMAEIIAHSDIAIGASGSTTWERCCLGIPTIQLITAKNQEKIAQNLDNINAVKLGEIHDIVKLLESFPDWVQVVKKNSIKITNGTGAKITLGYLL